MKKGILQKESIKPLLLITLILLSLAPIRLHVNAGDTPPSTGDWIIDSTVIVENEIIKMNGSIIITDNGSLTLRNSEIIFMGNTGGVADGVYNFTVQANGTLEIYNSELTTDDQSYYSYFFADVDSQVNIQLTTFNNFGYDSSHPALKIQSKTIYLYKNTIIVTSDASAAIMIENSAGGIISNCYIETTTVSSTKGDGIYVGASEDISLIENHIKLNGAGGIGIYLDTVINSHIQSNTIESYVNGYSGIYIYVSCENLTLYNNTITINGDSAAGIVAFTTGSLKAAQRILLEKNNITVNTANSIGVIFNAFLATNYYSNITIRNNQIVSNSFGMATLAISSLEISGNNIVSTEACITVNSYPDNNITITKNYLNSTNSAGITFTGSTNPGPLPVIISNNTIYHSVMQGISLAAVDNVEVSNNNILSVDYYSSWYGGIYLYGCDKPRITFNTIENIGYDALVIENVDNALITNNLIRNVNESSSPVGILVKEYTINTTISNNIIYNVGGMGINIDATAAFKYGDNITVSGNTIYNTKETAIYLGGYFDVLIQQNTIYNIISTGIYCKNSTEVLVTKNTIYNMLATGIYNRECNNLTVTYNTLTNIDSDAISSYYNTGEITIASNNIEDSSKGIYLEASISSSYNLVVEKNTIINTGIGIRPGVGINDSTIRYNFLYKCTKGIYSLSDNSYIHNNTFLMNFYGLYMSIASENNLIYYNDFIDNTIQVEDGSSGKLNRYSDYIPLVQAYLGNYWSDYEGIDVEEPFGFGDTPYIVREDDIKDEYPLMKSSAKIAPPALNEPADITIFENTTGYTITWIVVSIFDNITYTIYLNDSVIESGTSTKSAITFNIPKLQQGVYAVTISVVDPLGQVTNDTVIITVIPSEYEGEESAETFFERFDWISAGIGAGAGAIIFLSIILVAKAISHSKKKAKSSRRKSGN